MTDHFERPAKRESILWRNSKYRSNTSSGVTAGKWEAHHILCNHSVEGREVDENEEYVEDCLWITDWDLNDAHNMIGLPKNSQYRQSSGKVPQNHPSHQVDHNTKGGYTDECTDWLKANVWDTLNDKRVDHETNAKTIRDQLRAGSDRFRARLLKRGSRERGTQYCWEHRFPNPPSNATGAEAAEYKQCKNWFHPFSMAKRPNDRHPGVDWGSLKYIFRLVR